MNRLLSHFSQRWSWRSLRSPELWLRWLNFWTGPALPFVLLAGVAFGYARMHLWLCDDAFISFRYAQQWVDGNGLVFNVGQRVEGYTNFLWVVQLGVLHKLTGVSFANISLVLSSLLTVGTFVLTFRLAWRSPLVAMRYLAAFLACGWLAIHRNFAIWATSGLETRQFTFFMLLGWWWIETARGRVRYLALASLALGLAALTRPEGALILCSVGLWFFLDGRLRRNYAFRSLLALILPCAALVAAQYVFRWFYYGDLLPNTYYAKHVRPWPDMGVNYYVVAVIENGVYLALPLAIAGGFLRWFRGQSTLHLLSTCLLVPHALYLIIIGGDHFELRPLDLYWPLLALACADGFALVAFLVRRWARARHWRGSRLWGYGVALAGAGVCALYGNLLAFGVYATTYDRQMGNSHMDVPLKPENYPAVYTLPFSSNFVPVYNAAVTEVIQHSVAIRWREHERFYQRQMNEFSAYGNPDRRRLPPGAKMPMFSVGIGPFFLTQVTVIDLFGLTDRTIARNKVTPPNSQRHMAHDRQAPPGYIESQGANIDIRAARTSRDAALASARFAVELAPQLWMPFESGNANWVYKSFADYALFERPQWHSNVTQTRATFNGRRLTGKTWLGTFDDATTDWKLKGSFRVHNKAVPFQSPIDRQVGKGWLGSFSNDGVDAGVGSAESNSFEIEDGDILALLVAGGAKPRKVGVRLMIEGKTVATFTGNDSEVFQQIYFDLSPHTGQVAKLVAFDQDTGSWGHVMLDQAVILH